MSEAATRKILLRQSHPLYVGSCQMKGLRSDMQDRLVIVSPLCQTHHPTLSFFAVYDGHGSSRTAEYLCKSLHLRFAEAKDPENPQIIRTIIAEVDDDLRSHVKCGSTACILLVNHGTMPYKYTCINIGDSSCLRISIRKRSLLFQSKMHMPNLTEEKKRIQAAGFDVKYNRINHDLNISRTLGDWRFKNTDKQAQLDQTSALLSTPDISMWEGKSPDEVILLTTDGLTEQSHVSDLMEFICDQFEIEESSFHSSSSSSSCSQKDRDEQDEYEYERTDDAALVCAQLCDDAFFEKKSQDNMACILIAPSVSDIYVAPCHMKEYMDIVGEEQSLHESTDQKEELPDLR